MDNTILELEQLSQSIVEKLEDISYEDLVLFVDRRQELVDEMASLIAHQPPNLEQRERINALLQKDHLIEACMLRFKQEASDWLKQRDAAKAQRNAYESAYSIDSLLMDKRK